MFSCSGFRTFRFIKWSKNEKVVLLGSNPIKSIVKIFAQLSVKAVKASLKSDLCVVANNFKKEKLCSNLFEQKIVSIYLFNLLLNP
jgi:hypothetical protein